MHDRAVQLGLDLVAVAERGRVGARRRKDDGELPVRRRACGENQLLERRSSKI